MKAITANIMKTIFVAMLSLFVISACSNIPETNIVGGTSTNSGSLDNQMKDDSSNNSNGSGEKPLEPSKPSVPSTQDVPSTPDEETEKEEVEKLPTLPNTDTEAPTPNPDKKEPGTDENDTVTPIPPVVNPEKTYSVRITYDNGMEINENSVINLSNGKKRLRIYGIAFDDNDYSYYPSLSFNISKSSIDSNLNVMVMPTNQSNKAELDLSVINDKTSINKNIKLVFTVDNKEFFRNFVIKYGASEDQGGGGQGVLPPRPNPNPGTENDTQLGTQENILWYGGIDEGEIKFAPYKEDQKFYVTEIATSKWFNVNKARIFNNDNNLCWALSTASQLHWWFDRLNMESDLGTRLLEKAQKDNLNSFYWDSNKSNWKYSYNQVFNGYSTEKYHNPYENLYNHANLSDAKEIYSKSSFGMTARFTYRDWGDYPVNALELYFGYGAFKDGSKNILKVKTMKPLGIIGPDINFLDTSFSYQRGVNGTYKEISELFRRIKDEGSVPVLMQGNSSIFANHAIILWGAVFDEYNNVRALYVGDNDHLDPSLSKINVIYENGKLWYADESDKSKRKNIYVMQLSVLHDPTKNRDLISKLNDYVSK